MQPSMERARTDAMTVIKAPQSDPTEPNGDDGDAQSLERILALDLLMTVVLAEKEVYLRDITASKTVRISLDSAGNAADGTSGLPSLSGNGRFVIFASNATNLVSGDADSAPLC